jgi:hypothetical protein
MIAATELNKANHVDFVYAQPLSTATSACSQVRARFFALIIPEIHAWQL